MALKSMNYRLSPETERHIAAIRRYLRANGHPAATATDAIRYALWVTSETTAVSAQRQDVAK